MSVWSSFSGTIGVKPSQHISVYKLLKQLVQDVDSIVRVDEIQKSTEIVIYSVDVTYQEDGDAAEVYKKLVLDKLSQCKITYDLTFNVRYLG